MFSLSGVLNDTPFEEALDINLKTSTCFTSTGLTVRALGCSFRGDLGRRFPHHPESSLKIIQPKTQQQHEMTFCSLQNQKTTAVTGMTASIAFVENVNHLLSEAAWDMETKHRESTTMELGML